METGERGDERMGRRDGRMGRRDARMMRREENETACLDDEMGE